MSGEIFDWQKQTIAVKKEAKKFKKKLSTLGKVQVIPLKSFFNSGVNIVFLQLSEHQGECLSSLLLWNR